MDKLAIVPGESIGSIKIGMTPNELENTPHMFDYRAEYDTEGRVNFIEIGYDVADNFNCLIGEINLFNTKADALVERLDSISPYDRDEDSELGYAYKFSEIGLSLWRSVVLTEASMKESWFLEMSPEIQQDEMKHLYFESISVFTPIL
ncbi:hypothetical protein [Paenibacillus sp. OK003]|uniref:hypothetical protein n=1 Tax=Paenibacillus sp. OK003 TaxID=1884380 RepID=UPI0008AD55B4|nr:hypothetical protein [Paenibacillus sp. OK003]SEL81194.1 hypothetical protein SAMN05518856_11923 [Paenibacillus sp. OK003]